MVLKNSNVVGPVVLRQTQLNALETLYVDLKRTFGPNGSVTEIFKPGAFPIFTKDGLKTLREINFQGEIENSVKANIDSQCVAQCKRVGDATTSIVLLSYLIFAELDKRFPADRVYDRQKIMTKFQTIVDLICDDIKKNAQDANLDNIKEICEISTNGREDLVQLIMDQYDALGLDALIEVVASCNNKTEIIVNDGCIIEEGFKSGCYINSSDNRCILENAEIYFFDDPIDNQEMLNRFNTIFTGNIVEPTIYKNSLIQGTTADVLRKNPKINREYVPTVVICPLLSKDFAVTLKEIEQMMDGCNYNEKPPFVLVTNITTVDKFAVDDVCSMSGGKRIGKFLDPENQKAMKSIGKEVLPSNYHDFAGRAERVEVSFTMTKVYKPAAMFNDDGSYSKLYYGKLKELEAKYEELTKTGAPVTDTFNYKKRIDGLKGKMVQISYGGVSAQDRDMDVDALDDAILNARSAAQYGVGFGANFEALRAVNNLSGLFDDTEAEIIDIIKTAYTEVGIALYETMCDGDRDAAKKIVDESLVKGCPMNIRTEEYDGKVKSSIESDICIIQTISKILMVMFVANQFILPELNFNKYPSEPEK